MKPEIKYIHSMIKNIILDLGGVILDVDYNRAVEAFANYNIKNFDNVYTQKKQALFFDQFEKGLISPEKFRAEIRTMNPRLTDDEIDQAWNHMILETPPSRMAYLHTLSKNYNLYLLSNTNEIHIHAFTSYFETAYGKNTFSSLFKKMYLSSRMGMRKPEPEIFKTVISENNLNREETIFIDDSVQHITGARAVGLHAVLMPAGEQLESFLDALLQGVSSDGN